ncbi:MAG: hypothetical protein JNK64_28820 [Myxococcales bacterium]|nr:hypothetical protein [Myxococcales bacterium]
MRWIAAAVIVATGCGRGAAREPAAPTPLPVPAHLAGLFAGDRALTYGAVHSETVFGDEREEFVTTAGRLRCARQVAVIAEFRVARITCEDEVTPWDGDGVGDGLGGGDGDGVGDGNGDGDGDEALSMPIDRDLAGVYVTDGVGLWRSDATEPWPLPLAELRALVQTPALIAGVPVPGRDGHPTGADEERGDYHEVYRDDGAGLCGGDVSIGAGSSLVTWCFDGARGLYFVKRASDNSATREDRAELLDE